MSAETETSQEEQVLCYLRMIENLEISSLTLLFLQYIKLLETKVGMVSRYGFLILSCPVRLCITAVIKHQKHKKEKSPCFMNAGTLLLINHTYTIAAYTGSLAIRRSMFSRPLAFARSPTATALRYSVSFSSIFPT